MMDLDPIHSSRVASISRKVSKFHSTKTPFRIYHGSTHSTRIPDHSNVIDTSRLDRILHISPENQTALVEPKVSMEALVRETLKHGLIPPVVMEFPNITVGGGFAGTSGESSSFKFGVFERTVLRVEMVLGNGDVVVASAEENSDLFDGAASGFGTLGVITALELKLISAESGYVELGYISTGSLKDTVSTLRSVMSKTEEGSEEDLDYIDAIQYSPTSGVVIAGNLLDHVPQDAKIQRFTGAWDPWFYLHAKSVFSASSSSGSPSGDRQFATEVVPITDYLFRYDRGTFWISREAFKWFLVPFNFVTRFLLNPLLKTRVVSRGILAAPDIRDTLIAQDVGVPYDSAVEFGSYLDQKLGIYPLWLCPVKCTGAKDLSSFGVGGKDLLDFGVWGQPKQRMRTRQQVEDYNRDLEKKVNELGGRKCLYATAFYTEEEFWRIYDKNAYDTLRAKYHADYLPTVYDKVVMRWPAETQGAWGRITDVFWSVWPLSGLYGVYRAIIGSHYFDFARRREVESDID